MNTFICNFALITYHSIISIIIIFIVSNDVFYMLHVIVMYYMQCSHSLEIEETSPAIIYKQSLYYHDSYMYRAVLLISYREPFFWLSPSTTISSFIFS